MANERELLEFRRELAIVNHLAHPNIVKFLGAITNSMTAICSKPASNQPVPS
jgi:serine/threonine protein kinase